MLDDLIEDKLERQKVMEWINFYIGVDRFGKYEVLRHLASKYNSLISVSAERMDILSKLGFNMSRFTTDKRKGIIHIVEKDVADYVYGDDYGVGIILTGGGVKSCKGLDNMYVSV